MGLYSGDYINTIQLACIDPSNYSSLTIQIFGDSTHSAQYTQTVDVAQLVNAEWNDIELTTPYTISGNNVFICFSITLAAGGNFIGVTAPANPSGYGDLLYAPEVAFLRLGKPFRLFLDYNWMIRAVVDDGVVVSMDAGVTDLAVPYGCNLDVEIVTATVQKFWTGRYNHRF